MNPIAHAAPAHTAYASCSRWPWAKRLAATALACAIASISFVSCAKEPGAPPVQGIVWQPDNAHANPRGDWDRLGAHELIVQWTAVDGNAFVKGTDLREAAQMPDWSRIAREPWARDVIVGLAGRFSENSARSDTAALLRESAQLAAAKLPLHVTGWYYPAELDPSWKTAANTLRPILEALPKPLWISVYDRQNVGGDALATWLAAWLPAGVGVLLQDGCGEYAREPRIARQYADQLAAKLGKDRVRIIAEAFRPMPGGGMRAATAQELRPQLIAYRGYKVYLFDGPHYVSSELVRELLNTSHDEALH
ncbi:hypothetical protein GCM10027093_33940 [Paraburkholderia jirisanensis]